MRTLAAIALAVGVSLAGAAHAQNATITGMDCVYTALIPDYEVVAEAFLSDNRTEAQAAEVDELVESAKRDCAARFTYTPDQLQTAAEIGVFGSAVDYLSHELLAGGVSEASVGGILDAYDTFTDEDVDKVYGGDWREDAAFLGKIKAMMTGAGIPDNENMELAFAILEITVLMEEANYFFMLDEADKGAAAKQPTP